MSKELKTNRFPGFLRARGQNSFKPKDCVIDFVSYKHLGGD